MSDKQSFITIVQSNAKAFDDSVNEAMRNGYELHGPPQFQMVSCQDSWNDRQRAWTECKYVQCMKLK